MPRPRPPLAERVRVGPSPIHGQGCFALKRFRKGQWIGDYVGEPTMTDDTYVLWVNEGTERKPDWRGIDGKNALRHLNHSSRPNAELDGPRLYALRAIAPGDEITFHYGEEWEGVE